MALRYLAISLCRGPQSSSLARLSRIWSNACFNLERALVSVRSQTWVLVAHGISVGGGNAAALCQRSHGRQAAARRQNAHLPEVRRSTTRPHSVKSARQQVSLDCSACIVFHVCILSRVQRSGISSERFPCIDMLVTAAELCLPICCSLGVVQGPEQRCVPAGNVVGMQNLSRAWQGRPWQQLPRSSVMARYSRGSQLLCLPHQSSDQTQPCFNSVPVSSQHDRASLADAGYHLAGLMLPGHCGVTQCRQCRSGCCTGCGRCSMIWSKERKFVGCRLISWSCWWRRRRPGLTGM